VVPLAVLLVLGLLGSALLGPAAPPSEGAPPADRLIQPDGTGSHLWPYTSRSRSVGGRTLALNVLVHADAATVRQALVNRSGTDWDRIEGDAAVGKPAWRSARGAARYTYVAPEAGADGRWIRSAYQLGTGTYLGRRTHVRAYPGRAGSGDWTAFQAHTEYWDWFRLRHTVTGVDAGAQAVERDLRDERFVGEISRVYHGLDGGGSDGWLTVVRFAPAALLAAAALPLARGRGRWRVVDAVLPGAIVGIVLGVRAAGIAAEGLFPGVTPKAFAALLYPVLAVGPPLLVLGLARDRPPARTAALAAAALGAAVVLDLQGLGVRSVPISLALHRTALVGALGLVAFGVARGERRVIVPSALAWVLTLAAPLVGIV
jgi:hypothetical protein